MKNIFTVIIFCLFCGTLFAQSVEGVWETYDNKRNKPMSHVQTYIQDGKLYGKIIKVLDDNYKICTNCSGSDKDKPVLGMTIIRGLEKKDSKWEKDDGILDPVSGFVIDGLIWLESPNKLKVKGSFGFISDTQTWTRIK